MLTTLNKVLDPSPYIQSNLLAMLGKGKADDEPISCALIIEICGLVDGLWMLRNEIPRWALVAFACDCVEHALSAFDERYPDDPRPREAIATTRRYMQEDGCRVDVRRAMYNAYAAYVSAAAQADGDTAAAAAAVSAAFAAAAVLSNDDIPILSIFAAASANREWAVRRFKEKFGEDTWN